MAGISVKNIIFLFGNTITSLSTLFICLILTTSALQAQPPLPPQGEDGDFHPGLHDSFTIILSETTISAGDDFSVELFAIDNTNQLCLSYDGQVAIWLMDEAQLVSVLVDQSENFVNGVLQINNLHYNQPGFYTLKVTCLEGEQHGFSDLIEIEKRKLMLFDFFAADKTYDGTLEVFEHGFDDNRLPGHDVIISYTAWFADENAGNDKEVLFAGFEITGGEDAHVYYLENASNPVAYANIHQKTITIGGSFVVDDKEYDGTVDAEIIEDYLTLNGIIYGDDVTLEPQAAFESAEEGVHDVFLTDQTFITGNDHLNYLLSLYGSPITSAEIYYEYVFLSNGPWNNPNNWKGNKIPPAESKVRIAAQAHTRNLPIRGNGRVGVSMSGGVHVERNLTFANNAKLKIAPRGRVTVDGQINGAGKSIPSLVIQSDAEGSGSLINETNGINARVERYVHGSSSDWHMVASPVGGQPFNSRFDNDFTAGALFVWHEPLQSWVKFGSNQWDEANNNSSNFVAGKGYMIAFCFDQQEENSNPTYFFDGELHTGKTSITISNKAHPEDPYRGYNLIGNPYPSAIDWKATAGWSGREHLETAESAGYNMWIWNPEVGQYGVQNSASQTDYVHNGVSRFIPPMQAFWVKAAPEIVYALIEIDDQARAHTDYDWLKNLPSASPGSARLSIISDAVPYSDEAIIEFGHQNAAGGAPKMFSMIDEAPSLYTIKNNDPFSINFLDKPELHAMIPVGFIPGVSGTYTLQLEGFTQWTETVLLHDVLTDITVVLNDYSEYVFSASSTDDPARFLIEFIYDEVPIVEPADIETPSAYYNSNVLYINNVWDVQSSVRIYDITGSLIEQLSLSPNSQVKYPFHVKPGIYFVNFSDGRYGKTVRIPVGCR